MGRLIEKSRYLGYVGVISLLVAAIAAMGWGVIKTVNAISLIISSVGKDPYITVLLIELVDSFLIATVLYIFSVSLYELFIADLALPDWMVAHNLHELKDKLGGVIILVMAVKFLEHLMEWKDPLDSLMFAISVTIVSLALIALGYFGRKE
jgi:uncharacterized membrane protein YqhA